MDYKPKPNYAPFGSVSSKHPGKKKNSQILPGPGAYNVSLPLITPIVQTIKKSNDNVIIKLGHVGTAAFLAGSERFKQNDEFKNLGPGVYNNYELNRHSISLTKKQRKYASEKIRQIIKNPATRAPTISQIKQLILENQFEMPDIEQKTKSKKIKQNYRGINWSRMSQDRSFIQKSRQHKPGPGSYEIEVKQGQSIHKNPSSYFSSRSVRTYLDSIMFETNQDRRAREREQKNYKSDVVGPGSYDIEKKKPEKMNRFQFFSSTQQRM